MPICNSACSLCCLIISSWGVIQLVVMGVFYWFHSVALLEDIPGLKEEGGYEHMMDHDKASPSTVANLFYADADNGYHAAAMNCWIAACLYILSFLVSGHQFYMNSRTHV